MDPDEHYRQQVRLFEQLADRIEGVLKRFGQPYSLVHRGDFSIYLDYWGHPQVKVSICRLELLRPEIITLLQRTLARFPGWEIVVAVVLREHLDDWPDMGLIIRAHEIIDGLERQHFPKEFQSLTYAGSKRGSVV